MCPAPFPGSPRPRCDVRERPVDGDDDREWDRDRCQGLGRHLSDAQHNARPTGGLGGFGRAVVRRVAIFGAFQAVGQPRPGEAMLAMLPPTSAPRDLRVGLWWDGGVSLSAVSLRCVSPLTRP